MTTATTHLTVPQLETLEVSHPVNCYSSAVASADTSNSATMMGAVAHMADEASAHPPSAHPPSAHPTADAITADATTMDATTMGTAQVWAAEVAQEAMLVNCTTVGLINGSRDSTPRSVIDVYARLLADALAALRSRRPMLIVRLSSDPVRVSRREHQHADSAPSVAASPLGPWSEVTICVAAGKQARDTLERLSHLLQNWKREFGFVLVDLGPISEVPSRVIGGHCDSCFLLLGPESCGSHEWLLQQIAWHARNGSTICGTLVTELE